MAGATRSTYRKQPVRSVPTASQQPVASSSQSERQPSSGTTVADEYMHDVHGSHEYPTPRKTESSPERTDSRLSQDLEPLSLRNGNCDRDISSSAAAEVAPLGEHVKKAIAVISQLEGLGLQRLHIPLPKCVVLGEQSTGKSSVIEAISGIKTPRSTDTCTRCPLFISMQPSHEQGAVWQAQVVLRKNYSWNPKPARGPFPGWTPQEPEEINFATTKSPTELEWLIQRAQLATLSPLIDEPSTFLQPSLSSLDGFHRCDFSPNLVCIHITAPELPALSFYDLPGIIGQAESAEQHFLVKFVRNMVSEFVRDADSLILVTCSLENDIANSSAGGIARELKATNRCIGVLTKPDRLPPGSREDKLRNILEGTHFSLGHGYFVVKNPDQTALNSGLTYTDARAQERVFFESTSPWSSTLQDYQPRFGTLNLQAYLSEKLADQVKEMLPTIHEQILNRLATIEADIKSLPAPPTHGAPRTISEVLLKFTNHVRKEMAADYPYRDWRNEWETLHKGFLHGLMSMKPTMKTTGKMDEGIFASGTPGKSVDNAYVIDSDDEDAPMSESPGTPSPPKKRKVDEGTPSPMRPPPSRLATPSRAMDVKPAPHDSRYSNLRKVFELDEIARHLKETSKSKVPDQLEPKVIDDLIIATIGKWYLPMEHFFDDLKRRLKDLITRVFHEHFGKWQNTSLYREAWKIVELFLSVNFTEQETTMALESLDDEREGPYVFNDDVFNREKANTREAYRRARYRARLKIYGKEWMAQTGKAFTPQEEDKVRKDEKKRASLNEEPYRKEIDVIAQVTSYYVIAARRFYESVCMRIESKFFKRLRTTLHEDLEKGLGIYDDHNGPQNAMQLLAEPAHRLGQRQALLAHKNSLLQGLKCLQELQEDTENSRSRSRSQVPNGTSINNFGLSSFGPTSTPLTEDMQDITHGGKASH